MRVNQKIIDFHHQVIDGQFDEVKKAIQYDPSLVQAKGLANNTALHWATQNWRSDNEIITLLLAYGADMNAISSDGASPYLMAQRKGFTIRNIYEEYRKNNQIYDHHKSAASDEETKETKRPASNKINLYSLPLTYYARAVNNKENFDSIDNKQDLEKEARRIGLDTFANELFEQENYDSALQGPRSKDWAAIVYLLLTKEKTQEIEIFNKITTLIDKFSEIHEETIKKEETDLLETAFDIYRGVVKHADTLLTNGFTKNDGLDCETIIYLLKKNSCEPNVLKKLILSFIEGKFHFINSPTTKKHYNKLLDKAKQRFGQAFKQEIRNSEKKCKALWFYKILLEKVANSNSDTESKSQFDNIQTLISLYKFYGTGFRFLNNDQIYQLFQNHLKLIVNIYKQDKRGDLDAFLLDFVKRIYPYLSPAEKHTFIYSFNIINKNTSSKIQEIIKNQCKNRSATWNYPADSVDECAETIQSNALKEAENLELVLVRSVAQAEMKLTPPSEENPQELTPTLETLLENVEFKHGPAAINAILENTYVIKKTSQLGSSNPKEMIKEKKGWDILSQNSDKNADVYVLPLEKIPGEHPYNDLNKIYIYRGNGQMIAYWPEDGKLTPHPILGKERSQINDLIISDGKLDGEIKDENLASSIKSQCGYTKPFIYHLLDKAEKQESKDLGARYTARYIKDTVIPKMFHMPKEFRDLIFDNEYWRSKCRLPIIPTGIQQMQDLINEKDKKNEAIPIQGFASIAGARPPQGTIKYGLFEHKRNSITEDLYEAVKSTTWLEVVNSKKYQDVLLDRARVNAEKQGQPMSLVNKSK